MLRLGTVLLFVATLASASRDDGYEGFKLFEVVPKTQQQSDFLYDLSKRDDLYDFFVLSKIPNQPAHVMVHRAEIQNFLNKLAYQNLAFTILNHDMGQSVEKEFKLNSLQRNSQPRAIEGRLKTDRYYNHDEINNYIEYLAKLYPSRVVVKKVGISFMGRDLKTITISNGDGRGNKKVIFMDAGIHAREWISPATILYVIEQLVENFKENAELLMNCDFIILPVVNPDGYEYTQISRRTRFWLKTRQPFQYKEQFCYGSDVNRNFGFHWNEVGSSQLPCSNTYAGPHEFSEPETVVLRDLIDSFKDRGIFYLSLHSYGNYLLYPWAWTLDLPDAVADLNEIATVGAEAISNGTGIQYVTGSRSSVLHIGSGGSDDYAYQAGFKIAITMELSGHGKMSYFPDPSAIDRLVKEAWIGIRAMSKRVVDKYSK